MGLVHNPCVTKTHMCVCAHACMCNFGGLFDSKIVVCNLNLQDSFDILGYVNPSLVLY